MDSDMKISLYQSSIGTGLKAVPKVDRLLVQLMLSQKSIDFWYSLMLSQMSIDFWYS